jgi:hypothetical protein
LHPAGAQAAEFDCEHNFLHQWLFGMPMASKEDGENIAQIYEKYFTIVFIAFLFTQLFLSSLNPYLPKIKMSYSSNTQWHVSCFSNLLPDQTFID